MISRGRSWVWKAAVLVMAVVGAAWLAWLGSRGAPVADAPDPTQAGESAVEAAPPVETGEAEGGGLPAENNGEAVEEAPGTIRGWVVRGDTKNPVPAFEVGYLAGDAVARMPVAREELLGLQRFYDSGGRFRFTVRPEHAGQPVTVVAMANGLAPDWKYITDAAEYAFNLYPGVSVLGRVVESSGRPVAEAEVETIDVTGGFTSHFRESHTRTDATGRFSFVVPAAPVLFRAEHPDYAPGQTTVLLSPTKPAKVTVVVTRGGAIEGRVTRDGQPLAGAIPRIERVDTKTELPDELKSGEDGTFRIERVSPGDLLLSVREPDDPDRQSTTIQKQLRVEEGQTATAAFDFRHDASVEGLVLLDGAPAELAHVSLTVWSVEGQSSHSAEAEEGGRYRIEGIPPGLATANVSRVLERGDLRWVEVFEVAPGGVTRHDFNVPSPTGSLECRIPELGDDHVVLFAALTNWPQFTRSRPSAVDLMARIEAFSLGETLVEGERTLRVESVLAGNYTVVMVSVPEWLGLTGLEQAGLMRVHTYPVEVLDGEPTVVEVPASVFGE